MHPAVEKIKKTARCTMRHHVALWLLWNFEVPDGNTSVTVTTDELFALVMPAY